MTSPAADDTDQQQLSLATGAARNLATTSKTRPQTQGTSPRWLLRALPWVDVAGASYRVNRRLTYPVGTGKVSFTVSGDDVQVVPPTLAELPALRAVDDVELLATLAGRFTQRTYATGDTITRHGQQADSLILIAHGKVGTTKPSKYGDEAAVATLADGDHIGQGTLVGEDTWPSTAIALTPVIALVLSRETFDRIVADQATLATAIAQNTNGNRPDHNRHGEANIDLSSGHAGEHLITSTFVDYELAPREYELSIAQTVLQVHTRVADLYNEPHNQTEHQLRLTVEALRERQEFDLFNNRDYGLLHNVDLAQRIPTKSGPPTPGDMDNLLCRRRKTQFFLAHPKAIAAFGRECTSRGLYPDETEYEGKVVRAWRGVPLLPSDKIPITDGHTTSIVAMRTGEDNHGVVGLHETGLADELEPGLSVRFMEINEQAVISYLVTTYYAAAVLVPDALGVLEHVEIGR